MVFPSVVRKLCPENVVPSRAKCTQSSSGRGPDFWWIELNLLWISSFQSGPYIPGILIKIWLRVSAKALMILACIDSGLTIELQKTWVWLYLISAKTEDEIPLRKWDSTHCKAGNWEESQELPSIEMLLKCFCILDCICSLNSSFVMEWMNSGKTFFRVVQNVDWTA